MVKPIIDWRANSLDGAQSFDIEGVRFRVPAGAQIKFRPPLVWVLSRGVVHLFSRRGQAVLAQGEGRRFAGLWDRI